MVKNVKRLLESAKRMSHLYIFSGVIYLLTTSQTGAATYYVATTGNDANPGTITQPFASMQKGVNVAVAGDTVYLRGGTYAFNGPGYNSSCGVYISKSGASAANGRGRF